MPFRLHHPLWVEDPDFDLDYHIRRVAAPSPGGHRELAEVAAQIASTPLDRRRPLWELHVVEGLADGDFGMVVKVHHCAVDGVSGAELLVSLFDLEPGGREVEPAAGAPAGGGPERRRPGEPRASRRGPATSCPLLPLIGSTARAGRQRSCRATATPTPSWARCPSTAPATPWNRAISPQRRMSFTRVVARPT